MVELEMLYGKWYIKVLGKHLVDIEAYEYIEQRGYS
jgi:hypothetical protein